MEASLSHQDVSHQTSSMEYVWILVPFNETHLYHFSIYLLESAKSIKHIIGAKIYFLPLWNW